jgi:transcriptional regulator with XRE-family HTH domain
MVQRTAGPARIVRRKASEQKLKEIGNRIIWLRQTMGQTQAQFARYLQLPVEMLNRWERGTRQPNLDLLCILCRRTGATLDFILDDQVGPAMNPELLKAWLSQHLDVLTVEAAQQAIAKLRAGFAATLSSAVKPASDTESSLSSARPRRKIARKTYR